MILKFLIALRNMHAIFKSNVKLKIFLYTQILENPSNFHEKTSSFVAEKI